MMLEGLGMPCLFCLNWGFTCFICPGCCLCYSMVLPDMLIPLSLTLQG